MIQIKNSQKVYETKDYKIFKTLNGNRPINLSHVKRLKVSIAEKPIDIPIIVNEKMQVIDGQHRLEALKELNKPVRYLKNYGLNLKDVQKLNTTSQKWNMDAYLESYILLGYPEYVKYKAFYDEYGFNHNETLSLLNKGVIGGGTTQAFKEGRLKIHDWDESCKQATKIEMCKSFYPDYKRRSFVLAMIHCMKHSDFNVSEFIAKMRYQQGKLKNHVTWQQCVAMIEDIYNYKRPIGERIALSITI